MIHDLPSIRVRYDVAGKGGIIHLDPLYGRFDNLGEGEIPAGAMVEFSCPSCSVSLRAPEGTCETCAGNLFAIHLPGGIVEGCLRRGCHYHRMTIVDDGSLMDRLFSEHGRDSYL
ncbi:MAG: hypothetical protein FJY88_04905 [Candidatus Eisenbacteria bacterium]|nr:hypothetical protein [Candidatus Eisenbacteria bacterium]